MWVAIQRPNKTHGVLLAKIDQNMKINPRLLTATAIIDAAPHRLETLALNFVRLCFSFGIEDDARFEFRALAIAATNGILFSKLLPEASADFVEEVKTVVSLELPCPELNNIMIEDQGEDDTGVERLRVNLRQVLEELSKDRAPQSTNHKLLWAMAWGANAGRLDPAYAAATEVRRESQSCENQFIGSRLPAWALDDYEARNAPVIEFFEQFYKTTPVEREVICTAAYETLKAASLLRDPWDMNFWAQTGWSYGRQFAKSDRCVTLFEEAGLEGLKNCRTSYKDCVLGTTTPSGEVQLEKAILRFFSSSYNGAYARILCRGEERRLIVRAAFDAAYWFGIFSALPLQT